MTAVPSFTCDFSCKVLEAALAFFKEALSAFSKGATGFIKSSLLQLHGSKWLDVVLPYIEMKRNFQPDADEWDIVSVSNVLDAPPLRIQLCTLLVGSASSNEELDYVLTRLYEVNVSVVSARHSISHGHYPGIQELIGVCERMEEGMRIMAPKYPLEQEIQKIRENISKLTTQPAPMTKMHCEFILALRLMAELNKQFGDIVGPKKSDDLAETIAHMKGIALHQRSAFPNEKLEEILRGRNRLFHAVLDANKMTEILDTFVGALSHVSNSSTQSLINVRSSLVAVSAPNVSVVFSSSDPGHKKKSFFPQTDRDRTFVGRVNEMNELYDKVEEERARIGVHGTQGFGKTFLARKVVTRFEKETRYSSSSPRFEYFSKLCGQSLKAYHRDFVFFARYLRGLGYVSLPSIGSAQSDEDVYKAVVGEVTSFLCKDGSGAREFLVFVDDLAIEVADTLLESFPKDSRCSLLVTSVSDQPLKSAAIKCTKLEPLNVLDCFEIVHKIDKGYKPVEDKICNFIEESLGSHTLSVCQLAGLLKQKPKDKSHEQYFKEVSESYTNKVEIIRDRMGGATVDHVRGSTAFAALQFEKLVALASSDQAACEFAWRVVIFGHAGAHVPDGVLTEDIGSDVAEHANHLGLIEYIDDDLVFMHQVICGAVEGEVRNKQQMPSSQSWQRLVKALKAHVDKERTRDPVPTVEKCMQRLLPLMENLMNNGDYCKFKSDASEEARQGLGEVYHSAVILALNGSRFEVAEKFLKRAEELRGDVGQESISSLQKNAMLLEDTGKFAEALEARQQVLELVRSASVSSSTRADEANTLNDIGCNLESQGKYEDALSYKIGALRIYEDLYVIHPDLASSLMNVGTTMAALGHYPTARSYFDRALQMANVVKDGPTIAFCLENIGLNLCKCSLYPDGVVYLQKALRKMEGVYGKGDYLPIARCLGNIGSALCGWGESLGGKSTEGRKHLNGALMYFDKAETMKKQLLGRDPHGESLYHRAGVHHALDEHQSALECYLAALEVQEAEHKPSYPKIVSTLYGIGAAHYHLGHYQDALDYHQRSLKIAREQLSWPDSHEDVLSSEKALRQTQGALYYTQYREGGNTLFKEGNYALAIEAYTEAIKYAWDCGPKSIEMECITYTNRAACHLKLSDWVAAEHDCCRVLRYRQRLPAEVVGKALLRLAEAHKGMGCVHDALDELREAAGLTTGDVKKRINALQKMWDNELQVSKEKELYRRMLSSPPDSE